MAGESDLSASELAHWRFMSSPRNTIVKALSTT